MENLYAVNFKDRRDRCHVAVIRAATPAQAIERVVAYQTERGDFYYDILPKEADDMVEVRFVEDEQDPTSNDVCVVWHEDYD